MADRSPTLEGHPPRRISLTIDIDDGSFHFGGRLAEVIRKHGLTYVAYMGAGSVPLLGTDAFREIAQKAAAGAAITNNIFSSDLVGFPVTEAALAVVEAVDRDNSLARALHERAGFPVEGLPRTVATQFDIDTPTDVAILALLSGGHLPGRVSLTGGAEIRRQLRAYLAESVGTPGAAPEPPLRIDLSRYSAVLPLFLDQSKEIVVAGRVGSHAWSYLERETACRVRLFAEERGMEADRRAETGVARSLVGYYLDAVGTDRFFETLAELGDAAFIDTRVLLAHKRIDASREDRFLSDLGDWASVSDAFLRELTRGAVKAPIPVLLGGHSLMSGGLMALNEYAWARRDAGGL